MEFHRNSVLHLWIVLAVAFISIAFVLEVVNALDYIQGTRLALINYNKAVAGLLLLMCATKRE